MGRSIAVIPATAATVYLQEIAKRVKYSDLYPSPSGGGVYILWHNATSGTEIASNMHFDGGNLLFCDGHVKWRKYTSLRSGEFGLVPDEAPTAANSTTNYTAAF